MNRKQQGFTLIEIAIVLVIIGLLLGGVLKGQELITSARVRNLISQQDGVKAAFFGFQDRFRALPGDYTAATTNIVGVATTALRTATATATATAASSRLRRLYENVLAWEHLSKAGFINGTYTCAAQPKARQRRQSIRYGVYHAADVRRHLRSRHRGGADLAHNLKTGSQVPVDIMAEVDRKIDDGAPNTGGFQFSAIRATARRPRPMARQPSLRAPARRRRRRLERHQRQHQLRRRQPVLT